MNCKPGDLAKIVGASRLNGRLVLVHKIIETDELLPTGYKAASNAVGAWLCEFIGGPVEGPVFDRRERLLWWPIDDKWLRPIRGQDGEDETLQWAGKPQKEPA